MIFNKARDEKKTGGKPESPGKVDSNIKPPADPAKPQSVSNIGFCPLFFILFNICMTGGKQQSIHFSH